MTKIKTDKKLTSDDDQSALKIPHSRACEIVRTLMEYEGKKDLADGVITLPALRPFVYAYLFQQTLERLAEELRNLRGKFDAGRIPNDETGELDPETLAGGILETIASYLDCAAEDGIWSDDTASGLINNLRAELNNGVTTEELQLIKELPALHWSTKAFAEREREERVKLVRDTITMTPQRDLMKAQGFAGGGGQFAGDVDVRDGFGAKIEPRDEATLSPKTRQRIERVRETLARQVPVASKTEDSKQEHETPDPRQERQAATVAERIFTDVVAAMQQADEIGGPDDEDYVELMQLISEEAIRRRDVIGANMLAKKGAH